MIGESYVVRKTGPLFADKTPPAVAVDATSASDIVSQIMEWDHAPYTQLPRRDSLAKCSYVTAVDARGAVCGYAAILEVPLGSQLALGAKEWYLQSVAVHPAHRRRGLAKLIVGVVVVEAKRSGAQRMRLHTMVPPVGAMLTSAGGSTRTMLDHDNSEAAAAAPCDATLVSVWDAVYAAKRMYEALGFEARRRLVMYYDRTHDAVEMILDVVPANLKRKR